MGGYIVFILVLAALVIGAIIIVPKILSYRKEKDTAKAEREKAAMEAFKQRKADRESKVTTPPK